MNLDDYRKKRKRDPEYQAAQKELEPQLAFADRVLELRLNKGWAQYELAQRLDVPTQYVSSIEAGLGNPEFEMLRKIADVFQVKLEVNLRDV